MKDATSCFIVSLDKVPWNNRQFTKHNLHILNIHTKMSFGSTYSNNPRRINYVLWHIK